MSRESTLLFGNGINRTSPNAISWDELLASIGGNTNFKKERPPNTLIYERAVIKHARAGADMFANEKKIKKKLAQEMREFPTNELYTDLFSLGFRHYITTNYDYAFMESANGASENGGYDGERKYSLHRHVILKSVNGLCKIWHMHGEIDHANSIMLGLDHYSGSVGKIDGYMSGSYSYKISKDITINVEKARSIKKKLDDRGSWAIHSWVDLFFKTDVYILGLSLPFSEIDLWYILARRARTIASRGRKGHLNNEVYYYTVGGDPDIEEMLGAMNVTVIIIQKTAEEGDSYVGHYQRVIADIQKKRSARK